MLLHFNACLKVVFLSWEGMGNSHREQREMILSVSVNLVQNTRVFITITRVYETKCVSLLAAFSRFVFWPAPH